MAEIESVRASGREEPGFVRAIGLFDGTMMVVGSMIGSGVFIVAADISRQTGSAAGVIFAWIITGFLTIAAALSFGELAALFPRAGGQYVYLREAYSPLWGFLYGWTLFLVIQTGTIAAVAIGFARYLGVLFPAISPQAPRTPQRVPLIGSYATEYWSEHGMERTHLLGLVIARLHEVGSGGESRKGEASVGPDLR